MESTSTISSLKKAIDKNLRIEPRRQVWFVNKKDICPDNSQPFHEVPLPPNDECFTAHVYIFSVNNLPEAPVTINHISVAFLKDLAKRQGTSNVNTENEPDAVVTLTDPRQTFIETHGWDCPLCSLANDPFYPNCKMCTTPRPNTFCFPDMKKLNTSEREIFQTLEKDYTNYQLHLQEEQALRKIEAEAARLSILNCDRGNSYYCSFEETECPICEDPIGIGDGIVLRKCTHSFCKGCIIKVIQNCFDAEVRCPALDEEVRHKVCGQHLEHREIKGLLENIPGAYEERLQRELTATESLIQSTSNSFHCLTANCRNWIFYEEKIPFKCELCQVENCIACSAQHAPLKCKDYQEEQKRLGLRNDAGKTNEQYVANMIQKGEGMKCPGCGVLTVKTGVCFFLRCSACKMELCWGTKGPRWGPKGRGDESGGCKCNPAKPNCVPNCLGCTYE